MVLDEHLRASGPTAVQFTRLRATVHPPLAERLIIARRNLLNRVRFALNGRTVATGDVRFDALALVGCRSREYALQVLSEPVRVAWASFPKRAQLVCEGTTATLIWRWIETDRSVLDAASEVLLGVARATSKLNAF